MQSCVYLFIPESWWANCVCPQPFCCAVTDLHSIMMVYERSFVNFGWRRDDPMPSPCYWSALGLQQIGKIAAGSYNVLMQPCDRGSIHAYYFQDEWVTNQGEHYYHFIRAAGAAPPELLVRRLTARNIASRLHGVADPSFDHMVSKGLVDIVWGVVRCSLEQLHLSHPSGLALEHLFFIVLHTCFTCHLSMATVLPNVRSRQWPQRMSQSWTSSSTKRAS